MDITTSGSDGRTCRDCGVTGPLEDFAKHATSRQGRQNLCHTCFRIRYRGYAAARRTRVGTRVLNSTLANRWARLLQKAKYRSIPVEITRQEWEAIVADPCHYCGGPLEPTGYGLDRKDTHGAYSLTNVVPCCQACNRRKKDQPYDVAFIRISTIS